MKNILDRISHVKILPVIKIDNVVDASALANALMSGGIPIAEITLQSKAAEGCIQSLKNGFPDMLIGAGGVFSVEHVSRAVEAGAEFIVTPGFNSNIVDYCLERGYPVFPGVNSPTQVELGLERGLSVFHFFPAEVSGGIRMIKALAAVYTPVKFIAGGGINRQNIMSYLECEAVIACAGTWIANSELIETGAFDEITALVADVISLIRSSRIE